MGFFEIDQSERFPFLFQFPWICNVSGFYGVWHDFFYVDQTLSKVFMKCPSGFDLHRNQIPACLIKEIHFIPVVVGVEDTDSLGQFATPSLFGGRVVAE